MPARVLEGLCPHVDSEEAALDVADLTPESAHDDRLSRRDVPGVLEGQFQGPIFLKCAFPQDMQTPVSSGRGINSAGRASTHP